MKKGMKIEAVDVACIFGIEDKFPAQNLLTLILQESREPLKGRKRKANNSPAIHLEVILRFKFKITILFALLIVRGISLIFIIFYRKRQRKSN